MCTLETAKYWQKKSNMIEIDGETYHVHESKNSIWDSYNQSQTGRKKRKNKKEKKKEQR